MKKYSRHCAQRLLLIALFMLIAACDNSERTSLRFTERVEAIKQNTVGDLSLNVCTATLSREGGKWILKGETSVAQANVKILALADSLIGKRLYSNEFTLLPQPDLGDSTAGLVCVSVAHLRDHPRHSAQLVDQAIMGRELKLLKRLGGWYLIQTDYGYVGWMRAESFSRTDAAGIEAWRRAPRAFVVDLFPMAYSLPDENSEPVSDLVLNCIVKVLDSSKGWSRIEIPDGRTGFIRSSKLSPADVSIEKNVRDSVIRVARSMMGIPYLWGGNSSKGNDCSGFTQTVFKANGIQLLRDARQQVNHGEAVIPDARWSNVLPGDLLFFGTKSKITHVGISLGGREFVHQSGAVKINSLNPEHALFSEYRLKSLQAVRRVL